MIFCMPVRASPSEGPLSKPSRLSISDWFRTRAACALSTGASPSVSAVSAPQAAASSSSVCSVVPLIGPASA